MKKGDHTDNLSIAELITIILLFVCYVGTLCSIVMSNRPFLILFFVLYSVVSVIFFLISHDKMARLALQETDDASHQLAEEMEMISQYSAEIASLKQERDELLIEKEQSVKKQEELESKITELTASLDGERAHEQAAETASLNHLLPQNENPVDLDIIDAADRVIKEMTPYSQQAGILLQLSCASDTLMVRADASFIRIMFRNIIDNSIKYMNRNGSLVITISNIGDDLFIVLKDNGEGLSASETPRIFELNYQGSNRVSGNGLGLTQAKAIVEYYGGTIYAKSECGKGMGVYIQLPAGSR